MQPAAGPPQRESTWKRLASWFCDQTLFYECALDEVQVLQMSPTLFPGAAEASLCAGLLHAQRNGWSGWLASSFRIFPGSCQTYNNNWDLHSGLWSTNFNELPRDERTLNFASYSWIQGPYGALLL